jgi:shikimate kinase
MKNIILIGYMGSGKSTVGKNLAMRKGYRFADTDEMIVKNEGKSINEIFSSQGEQEFRDMETRLLEQLIAEKKEGLVISTGGGMPLREENRKLLDMLGIVVYLKASARTIYDRIKGDTTRPLLQCDNPRQKINDMIEQRGPIYEESASVTINVDSMKQSEVADEIIRRIY